MSAVGLCKASCDHTRVLILFILSCLGTKESHGSLLSLSSPKTLFTPATIQPSDSVVHTTTANLEGSLFVSVAYVCLFYFSSLEVFFHLPVLLSPHQCPTHPNSCICSLGLTPPGLLHSIAHAPTSRRASG